MTSQDDKTDPQEIPKQRDLFGVVDKRQRQVDELIARNKADRAAGIKPVPQPLFPDNDGGDEGGC